jgi:hypothetical protein
VEWTKAALEARVAKLASDHEGEALVAAVREFSDQLAEDERALLGQILLERAPARAKGVTQDYPKWSVLLGRRQRR